MQAQRPLPLSQDGYLITIDAYELNNTTDGKTVRMDWREYVIAGFWFGAGFLLFNLVAGFIGAILLSLLGVDLV